EAREQGLEALLDGVYRTGERFVASERPVNLPRNGSVQLTYINFVYEALREADGQISGIMAVASEVTEQVAARKKIEEAEERARLAIEASRLGIWDYNPLTEELRFDEATMALFEHNPAVLVNLDAFWNKMHPDDQGPALVKMQGALDPTLPDNYHAEYRLLLATGVIRWIEATGQAFFDENKVPLRFSGTVQDITDRKEADNVLRMTTERFRLLADSMPQFVWTANIQGKLNYFNRAVYDYSGLPPDEVDQDGWLQIVHPDDRTQNVQRWMHSIQTGEDFLFEHRFRRQDGEYRWQLSRAVSQRDEQGNIQLWVGTSTNIHDQKRSAQELENQVRERTRELEKSNANLKKSNANLAEFTYVASHDLQEPLRKIQAFANLILHKEYQSLSGNAQDYFQRMHRTAERMQTLIDDLLTYSRTNTTELVFAHVHLNQILEEVKDDLKELIQEKHAVIESNELCPAYIIPFQFRQMITNLLSNALKFTKADITPHITIKASVKPGHYIDEKKLVPDQQYCHIEVIDNGIGFDAQFNERIFLLFQKLHGRHEYKGTGIGLAIVKKIVENHQGVITASGELGKGARFDIYLPT
ncbi:MAG: PAS domain-containing protein, partial [Saprospiraceae bacterium]|nr:PAS domain-containing protein [Saprospiraceae bacterium]